MSLALVHTRAQVGVEAPPVVVEAHLANGLPALTLVGLPETAVREAKDRGRSAILNAGFEFPSRRITLNLAPGDLPKDDGRFDLALAIGILAASGQLPAQGLDAYECLGELALSGAVRAVRGVLPAALAGGSWWCLAPMPRKPAWPVASGCWRSITCWNSPSPEWPGLAGPLLAQRPATHPAALSRSRRSPGPAGGQARPGGGRGRCPQPAAGRPTGNRQDAARQSPAGTAATPGRRRGAAGGRHPFGGLPRAA